MKPKARVCFFIVSLIYLSFILPNLSNADPLDTWHVRTSPTTNTLRAVTYGNGTFVAVGDAGTILTSPDGLSWTIRLSGTTAQLKGIAYGDGTFVAVGDFGTFLSSSDGLNWSATQPSLFKDSSFSGITFGNGTFVAVGNDYSSGKEKVRYLVLSSTNGMNWEQRFLGSFGTGLSTVTFGPNMFVAAGKDVRFGIEGAILTSSDGTTWLQQVLGSGLGIEIIPYGIIYGNDLFVTVGHGGIILTSPDALNWTQRDSNANEPLMSASFGNGTFAAAGGVFHNIPPYYGSASVILTSTNGLEWTRRITGVTNPLYGITHGIGTFVAVGYGGIIIQSDPLADKCTAILSPALSLKVPIINLDQLYLSAELKYEQIASDIMFRVTSAGVVPDANQYSVCQASILAIDGTPKLHVPVISFGDSFYRADFEYVPTSDIMFKATSAGMVTNIDDYSSCAISSLSLIDGTYGLHVPAIIFDNVSYSADFEYVPTNDGHVWFKLTGAGLN